MDGNDVLWPAFATGGTAGRITWTRPFAMTASTAPIVGQELSYSLDGRAFYGWTGSAWSAGQDIGTVTTYNIDGLRPGTNYWCRWRCRNSVGWSLWSPTWRHAHPEGTAAAGFKLDRGRKVSGGSAPMGGAFVNAAAPAIVYKPCPLHQMPYFERAPASLADAVAYGPGVTGVSRLYCGIGMWTGGAGSPSFNYDKEYDLTSVTGWTVSWQWQRGVGATWSNVGTGDSYTIQAADRGAQLRCVVTVGGVAATSNAITVP
jgi:hypothetical protein